jgi:hypothetical protein
MAGILTAGKGDLRNFMQPVAYSFWLCYALCNQLRIDAAFRAAGWNTA